jgi:catechol-2,3-dioxygenase
MQSIISDLVERFDAGTLSRRRLMQGLTLLAATGAATKASAQATPFTPTGIDHISIQVSDMAASMEFYQSVFGLSVINEDTENQIVRMGRDRIIVSLHAKEPTGIVDHFAIAIEEFDRNEVTRALASLGLTAQQNLDYGFYVRDPENIPVQIVGAR